MSSFRRRLMMAQQGGGGSSVPGVKESEAGDICVYDVNKGSLAIIKVAEWSASKYPIENYVPIGVVVVPASHNVYGDGSCAISSLMNMDFTNPDQGVNSIVHTSTWGDMYTNIPDLNDYGKVCYCGEGSSIKDFIIGVTDYAHLPSDLNDFTGKSNPYDNGTKYYDDNVNYYIPSPYRNDGSFNTNYNKIDSPSNIQNCLSDFNGKLNTSKILNYATSQPNWKTDKTLESWGIENQGLYPIPCCCWRFHTHGTNQDDWYLPAMGELGYIMVRSKIIDNTILKLIEECGNEIGTTFYLGHESEMRYGCSIFSSSEHDVENIRVLWINNGRIGIDSKGYGKGYPSVARAFLRINQKGIVK